ncbi:MAG: response regulator transcription factor [Thaumarchaeota archaeon]|nr:response regulator transcription factor [Nitrososphaerota archaeon]
MKILVVDDNESIVRMLKSFFELRGYECMPSLDGRNALDLMTREKFDAVILDLAMPEFSGYDIIDELGKSGKIKDQNIIVLTASSIASDKINLLLKQGIKSCLKKPVTPEVLLDILSSVQKSR